MKTDQWSAAASELQADRRAELGDRVPELDTLQAFFRDELLEEDADIVREFLVLYPEVAAALMADGAAPPIPGPGHPAHLSAAEREAGWRDLAERLDITEDAELVAAPSCQPPGYPPRWHTAWAIAATLAFGALLVPAFLPSKPQVLVAQWLAVDQPRGPAAALWPVQIQRNADEVLLKLSLPRADALERYRLELHEERDGDTRLLWQQGDIAADQNDTIHLILPTRRVPPGLYRLRLQLEGQSTDTRTWEYRFETQ